MTSPVSDGCIAEFQLCDVETGSHKGLDRVPFVIRGKSVLILLSVANATLMWRLSLRY